MWSVITLLAQPQQNLLQLSLPSSMQNIIDWPKEEGQNNYLLFFLIKNTF